MRQLLASGATTAQIYDITSYTSVTVLTHGGTGSFTLEVGTDDTTLLTHSTPAGDTITTITDNILLLKVTPNTGGTYDVVAELR